MYPKDIRLFNQGSKWFAAYLEGPKQSENSQQIVIKEYQVIYKNNYLSYLHSMAQWKSDWFYPQGANIGLRFKLLVKQMKYFVASTEIS